MNKTLEDVLKNAIQNTISNYSWPKESSHDYESVVEVLRDLLAEIEFLRHND